MSGYDCIVIGAGAAGLMCASVAGQRGKSVLVLDHANKAGKKILMSGGGRCNFTNYFISPENYLSNNQHFCKSALSRYTQYDFLELLARYQLQYHEKAQGQLFCDHKASDILNILLSECERAGVQIKTKCEVRSVQKGDENSQEGFSIDTVFGLFRAKSVVIATGGLSIPTMGASAFGYQIAKQFGMQVTELAPALVPFTTTGSFKSLCESLAGVSLPVCISTGQRSFSDDLLFTHRGMSGPAVLQITNYWQPGQGISINFVPAVDLHSLLGQAKTQQAKKNVKSILGRYCPNKFVAQWLAHHDIHALNMADMSERSCTAITSLFQSYELIPGGTEGYRTAEVTRGGVSTDELSSKTFESKKVPGLFFIGEVLDVTGWLGGFNFQWAWSSAYCAAQYV